MKVLLLALSGFDMHEFSAFTDVLGRAKQEGEIDIEYETAGFSREVRSAFGDPITVDRVFWRRGAGVCSPVSVCEADYDALAIPGGFDEYGYYEEAHRQDTVGLIRAFHKAGKPVATVPCGPSTAVDAVFLLLEMLTDRKSAERVKTLMDGGYETGES